MTRKAIFVFALFLAALLSAGAPACAKPSTGVEFATYLDWGAETDAQYVYFMSKLFEYMSGELKIENARYKHYTSHKEFFSKFVKGKGPRYVIVGNRADMTVLIRDYGFKPVIAYDVVGLKRNRACLYVPGDSGVKTTADLRGKRLGVDQGPFPFCLLDSVLDARPNKFFSSIEETTTGLEAVYMLSLKKTDAVFVTDQIMGFLKKNNPGAVHGLKKLECGPHYMFLPLLAKDAPAALTAKLLPLLKKVEKGQALAQHHGIIKLQDLKFKTVGIEDFKWDIDFYTRAEKSGCVDDYNAWLKSLKTKDK